MMADSDTLAALLAQARREGCLAIDTEFMGEGRYRTLLCLIQLAVAQAPDGAERIVLVDPLQEDLAGTPLAAALADPKITVVLHAGRQDVALLRRVLRTEVTSIFDTQVAAGFAGLGAQSSYENLLAEVLGLRVAKTASFTRWDARPLSTEQLAYAREDVVHLLELSEALQERLERLGRLQWAREECQALSRVSDERDLDVVFERLPRVNGLSGPARAIARELVQWRERLAERHDRPVQSVLSDAGLVEVAKRKPSSREELGRIRGVASAAGGRRAEDLLAAVARGAEREPDKAVADNRPPAAKPEDAPLVSLAEALVRARAREAGLAYELLAARADLQAIVVAARTGAAEPDVRTLRGWRRELVGAELLSLLAGEISLSVDAARGDGPRHVRVDLRREG